MYSFFYLRIFEAIQNMNLHIILSSFQFRIAIIRKNAVLPSVYNILDNVVLAFDSTYAEKN